MPWSLERNVRSLLCTQVSDGRKREGRRGEGEGRRGEGEGRRERRGKHYLSQSTIFLTSLVKSIAFIILPAKMTTFVKQQTRVVMATDQ